MKIYLLISFLLLLYTGGLEQDNHFDESTYFATWATAVYETEHPKLELTNNSIRQIVHISASGENLRLKLSNRLGKTKMEIKEITIADSLTQGTGEIVLNTLTPLTFNGGEKGIIISPGEEIYSDTISYSLKALSEIAISIYFGETPENLTGHPASRTNSFIEEGNKIYNQSISRENKIAHWYVISAVEVSSNPRKKTIVCFGDSITDGSGSTDDKQNRWPDLLSTKLHLNLETSDIAVVNKGIGGNKITTQGLERFSYDVLEVKGVSHIIVLYGVNDINNYNSTSSDLISAYKQIIYKAHKNNIYIYGGTILPYGKYGKWNEEREKSRQETNDWIRTTKKEDGGFDGFFDFDKLIRDPDNPQIMYSSYDCGDGLHPSPEGYQQLVQAIDNLDIFNEEHEFIYDYGELKLFDEKGVKFKLDFKLEKGQKISVNIKGISNGSYGFRFHTANEEGIKTSDYFYSGKYGDCQFGLINMQIIVNEESNYIVIRRPLSTINIENIILKYLEVVTEDKNKIFEMEEGVLLE